MRNAYNPKKRNTGERKRKRIFLISVEGSNKTEKNYFNDFTDKNTRIIFAPGNATDPISIANSLVEEYEKKGLTKEQGDRAFCIVDGDVSKKQEEQILKADKIVKAIKGQVIVSNPCIEVWFLCHYVDSTRQYTSGSEVIKRLQQYIPGYEKNMKGIKKLLDVGVRTAVTRAKKLEEYNNNNGRKIHRYDYQPSTEVYKVVEELINRSEVYIR